METRFQLFIDDEDLVDDRTKYWKLIDRLIYLNAMWLDITYTVQFLFQFMQNPHQTHIKATIRILKYLKNHVIS